MAKVSVVIPCYNASAYLPKCLEALESQTFKDFDVYLVNDCSTDNTEEVIQSYKEKGSVKIYYLLNERNLGPAFSRNSAIKSSDSEYICFCDSDDWYEPDFIESMVVEASKNNADLVFCDYQMVFDSGKERPHYSKMSEEHLAHRESVLPRSTDSLWAMMVRRAIIAYVPQPDLRNGEDMAVIPIIVANCSRFGKVDKCIYNYYCRENSVSNTASLKVVDSLLLSFEHIKANMPKGFEHEIEFIGVRNLVYGALLILFKCGYNKRKAEEILEGFEKYFPKWMKSDMISIMPLTKRIFVWFASHRMYSCLWLLSKLHSLIVKKG